jgi:hypothetical protein
MFGQFAVVDGGLVADGVDVLAARVVALLDAGVDELPAA